MTARLGCEPWPCLDAQPQDLKDYQRIFTQKLWADRPRPPEAAHMKTALVKTALIAIAKDKCRRNGGGAMIFFFGDNPVTDMAQHLWIQR